MLLKVGTFGKNGNCNSLASFLPGLEEERGSFLDVDEARYPFCSLHAG